MAFKPLVKEPSGKAWWNKNCSFHDQEAKEKERKRPGSHNLL
jgi:hypothetical protein